MIELQNIDKYFNKGTQSQVRALRNVSLKISDREFVVIVGSNGSGKSTLLNLLSGTLQPSSGRILLNNNDITGLKDYQRSRWIARVFQDPLAGTAPELSIIDNFRLASLRTEPKNLKIGVNAVFKDRVRAKVSLLRLGLEDKLDQPVGTLSGGQRQALTLLMTTMDDADILLLDEPTAALDPRSADIVLHTADELIRQYQLTAILITHNIKDAVHMGSRIIQMSEGNIIRDLGRDQKQKLVPGDVYDWF